MNDSLVKLFCELVAIPSPSGDERKVAERIEQYLQRINVAFEYDNSGIVNNSTANNMIVRLPGDPDLPTLLFVAHMDTVETGEKPVRPIITNDIIHTDGTTILGADDKAAIACLLEMVSDLKTTKSRPTIIVAFTTREEKGQMGSSLLALQDNIVMAFNIDGPNNLGDFAYQMLGEVPFTLAIHGKAAHAAVEPHKGANAVLAASRIVSALPIGKTTEGVVLNIGTLQGGTANNIVPDKAVMSGQARAYTQAEIDATLHNVEAVAKRICAQTGCTYTFIKQPQEGAPPAALPTNHAAVRVAENAARVADVPFSLIKLSGTSDANYLAARYPTLTICRGSTNPHAFTETIAIKDLHGLKRLALAIVAQVAG